MYTIAETEVFSRYVSDYWTEDERAAFAVWIAEHYDTGDIIPGSGGCRKVRWSRKGKGKSGGARVITHLAVRERRVWLLSIYDKSEVDSVPLAYVKALLGHIPP